MDGLCGSGIAADELGKLTTDVTSASNRKTVKKIGWVRNCGHISVNS
jgi:hypothetical protein